MRIFKLIKSAVHHADFFSTTQLIRYQQEPQFKTFTGGIFSLMIVILLGTIFFNMSLSAVRRQHIVWAGQVAKDAIPPRLDLNFSTFNIGVQLQGFNLSSPIQYFDVIMTLYSFQNKELQGGGTRIPLTMCRREDWAINDDILGNFDRMNATNWLCPDVTSSFFVQGKWTSDQFTYLSLDVVDCGTVNKNAVCANRSQIDKALYNIMHFSVYYINALVTPDQKQPISYYLQDKDYVYFGKTNGGANYIFISDYQITTDHSIFPYEDNHQINGGIVMLPTRISVQQVANGWYASFIFRKAVDRYVYTRNFTKFDTVVSYTGGLFGALIGVLFLMNHYTRTSFQVALGSTIYSDNEDGDDDEAKNMNLFRYIKYHIYRFLLFIGSPPDWKSYQKFDKCRVQIKKHLDIKFILDKLNFMERTIFAMCGQQKFKALHLRNKVTIKDAQKFREYYFIKSFVINSLLKSKKEKKQTYLLKQKEGSGKNDVQSPSSIFSQSTPFFNIGKGKVMPLQPQNGIQQLSDNKYVLQKDQKLSDSLQTYKFTRKTRRYIEQMRSYLSSMQSVQIDNPDIEIGDLANQLQQIKRDGENGDILCRQIWNNLDNDIKFIIQHKMGRFGEDIILQRQDISNSANEPI